MVSRRAAILSLLSKLLLLSALSLVAIAAITVVSTIALRELSRAVGAESRGTDLVLSAADFERRTAAAWSAVYRAQVASLSRSSDLNGALAEARSGLDACKAVLSDIESASAGMSGSLADITKAFDAFDAAARDALADCESGAAGKRSFQIAIMRYSSLSMEIVKLDDLVKTESGDAVERAEGVGRSATIAFLPQRDGARAVQLTLAPAAKVSRVATPDGVELPFVRDHLGGRFSGLDNELYDSSLVVVFPEPMARLHMQQVVVDYTMKTFNFASGREWYPAEGSDWDDFHTARVRFKLAKKMQVRCVGELEEEKQEGGLTISTWSVTRPTRALGYSFGDFEKEKIKLEGVPEEVAFGATSGVVTGNMIRNVAIDVANSLHFYQWYFNVKFPFERMQATCISGFHGQAFEGFLHLSQLTFNAEHPGASELFRAHEVAHELWGHAVGWKSYRDQWLSEAFAEYSAMMFVEATMPKEGYFEEMLQVYSNEQTGSLKAAMSKFARPWNMMLTPDERRLIGPIAAGERASTARVPSGYEMQCYNKGAMVLHMLRSRLSGMARDRELFREVMQDFLTTYTGKMASTADFQSIVEKHTGASWQSFFDQWVYGTDIPTLTWSATTAPGADGKLALTLNVKTTDAPGFRQPVPVQVVFKGDKTGTFFVQVDGADKTMSVPVPEAPKKVVLAPRYSVLAKIKEQ